MKEDIFYNRMIMDKLEEEGHKVLSFYGNTITAKINGFEIQITHERCSCHGGRLSISAEHCKFYKRFESPKYDNEKGIIDEDTELEYYIKHEMLETVCGINKYVYAMEHTNRWSPEDREYRYFDNLERMSHCVASCINDIFTISEPIKVTFPNKDIYEIVNPVKYENGIMEIEVERFTNGKKEDGVETYKCYVFNKLRKRR